MTKLCVAATNKSSNENDLKTIENQDKCKFFLTYLASSVHKMDNVNWYRMPIPSNRNEKQDNYIKK